MSNVTRAAGEPMHCELRVRGRLGRTFLENFESLDAEVSPVESVIRGTVRDRAELFALLERLQLFGIELVQLAVTDADELPTGPTSPFAGATRA